MNDESTTWRYWQRALDGEFLPVSEDDPQTGYYRVKDDPVAIFENGGAMVALRRGKAVETADIWSWACKRPIPHELYESVMAGGRWPDDIEAEIASARRGHNGGTAVEMLADEVETVERAFWTWLQSIGGQVSNELDDIKAETFSKRLLDLAKRADAAREEEKRPYLQAGRDIDAAWRPVITLAREVKDRVGEAAIAYRVQRDTARREAAAARRAAAAANIPAPEPAPARVNQKKGFREVKSVAVTDPLVAVTHILATAPGQPDIIDAIRVVAARMIKAGVAVPGITIITEQRA